MTNLARKMDMEDVRFLYDLSIYNCLKYGLYKALFVSTLKHIISTGIQEQESNQSFPYT